MGEMPFGREEMRPFLRDLYDHFHRLADELSDAESLISTAADIYFNAISTRLNEMMAVLSIVATVFLPLTLITGIYGMNFKYMPELGWKFGYPAVLGVMALIAVALLLLFKRKGWI